MSHKKLNLSWIETLMGLMICRPAFNGIDTNYYHLKKIIYKYLYDISIML